MGQVECRATKMIVSRKSGRGGGCGGRWKNGVGGDGESAKSCSGGGNRSWKSGGGGSGGFVGAGGDDRDGGSVGGDKDEVQVVEEVLEEDFYGDIYHSSTI